MFGGLSGLLARGSLSGLFVRLGRALAILERGIYPKQRQSEKLVRRRLGAGTPEFVRLFDGRRRRMLIDTH